MLNFIHAHIAELSATGALVGMFGYVIYLNLASVSEFNYEESLRKTEPIHRTCELDRTLTNRQTTDKLVDVTMKAGLGILEALLLSAAKNKSANPVQAALHPDTVN